MIGAVQTGHAVQRKETGLARWAARHWFLLAALLLFVGPSLVTLIRRTWSTDDGAAGPIILASGLWLLVREAKRITVPSVPAATVPTLWSLSLLPPILIGYVAGRVFGMLWLDWLCAYAGLLWVAHVHVGWRTLGRLWFPLAYLLFLVPPPYTLVAVLSHSRKLWLATTSVDWLSALGFQTAYSGTTLYIDQYELLIANACAGMNSLISLLAIILFYIYVLHRANWRYAVLLVLLSAPVAMAANLVRIILLLLLTHYAGVAASEGVAHELAGVMMFVVALGVMIAVDALLSPLRRRMGPA